MKIFYIIMSFPTLSETFACNDIKTIIQKGVDVSVHCLRPKPSKALERIKERGLENVLITHNSLLSSMHGMWLCFTHPALSFSLFSFIIKNISNSFNQLVRSFILFPRVVDLFIYIKTENPDIVHLFWGHYPVLVGYLVKEFCPDIKLTMFLGAYDLESNYGGSGYVAKISEVVLTHCRANVKKISKLSVKPKNIKVSYRGVDLTKIKNISINKQSCLIISAGTLDASKRMNLVLKVFQSLIQNIPEARLIILGDGNERTNLENLSVKYSINDFVDFKGHVAHDIVFNELAQAKVFLFLSNKPSERLPNVVKEAMAVGCVCVVNQTVGIEELIIHNENGYIINPDNIDQTVQVIAKIFRSKELFFEISNNARKHIYMNFNIQNTMAEYVNEWQLLIKGSKPINN
jgi:colanic acid/amylovoran biosynthesis glycosyltransferase